MPKKLKGLNLFWFYFTCSIQASLLLLHIVFLTRVARGARNRKWADKWASANQWPSFWGNWIWLWLTFAKGKTKELNKTMFQCSSKHFSFAFFPDFSLIQLEHIFAWLQVCVIQFFEVHLSFRRTFHLRSWKLPLCWADKCVKSLFKEQEKCEGTVVLFFCLDNIKINPELSWPSHERDIARKWQQCIEDKNALQQIPVHRSKRQERQVNRQMFCYFAFCNLNVSFCSDSSVHVATTSDLWNNFKSTSMSKHSSPIGFHLFWPAQSENETGLPFESLQVLTTLGTN